MPLPCIRIGISGAKSCFLFLTADCETRVSLLGWRESLVWYSDVCGKFLVMCVVIEAVGYFDEFVESSGHPGIQHHLNEPLLKRHL